MSKCVYCSINDAVTECQMCQRPLCNSCKGYRGGFSICRQAISGQVCTPWEPAPPPKKADAGGAAKKKATTSPTTKKRAAAKK